MSLASGAPVALASQALLTPVTVTTLARQLAKKHFNLQEYEAPRLAYEVTPGSDTWSVHYERKRDQNGVVTTGAWFLVLVDDKTETVRFWLRASAF